MFNKGCTKGAALLPAVFANYLQHARHEFLSYVGVSADAIAQQGDALALSELNLKYVRPLRSGDSFRVTCHVARATGARLVLQQEVYRLLAEDEQAEEVSWYGCLRGSY